LIDESEDSSKRSILLIFVRFWSRIDKRIRTKLLDTIELKSKNAESIFKAVKKSLENYEIYKKVAFLCTDGCPAMLSDNNGVVGKFI